MKTAVIEKAKLIFKIDKMISISKDTLQTLEETSGLSDDIAFEEGWCSALEELRNIISNMSRSKPKATATDE